MRRFPSAGFPPAASLIALAVAISSSAAFAQDETPADLPTASPAETADSEESIVVTGSRIPRANFDTPQPAVVLGGEQIEQRGYTNLADALEELPAFGVPGSSPVGAGQGGAFGSGQNFINFFGLGDQRTLTLVNGRRFVSSNTASIFGPSAGGPGGQVDFNVLPTLLVDRVETIAVGGAPIYGSDAIAGTVNVILKRNFTGIQVDGTYGISERGDLRDWRIRAAAGTSFAGGRGNIAIAGEYNESDGLDYTGRPDRRLNSFFTEPADPDSPFAQTYIEDRRIPSISETGIPMVTDFIALSPEQAAAFGFQPAVVDAAGNPLTFDDSGNLVPIDFGEATGNTLNFNGGSGFVLPLNLISPLRRYMVTALAQYELTDNVRLFGEAWYSNSRGTQIRSQPEYASFLFGSGPGTPGGQFIIDIDNPFLSDQARAIIQQNLAANPAADSTDSFYLTRASTDLISGQASSEIELYRFVAGLDGTFEMLGRELSFELVGNYGHSRTEGRGRALVQQNLENALNAVDDGSGNIICAPGFTNAPVTTLSSTCAPINPFGRQISPEARDYVTAITDPVGVNEQIVGTASVSGSLFDIWGGSVRFALGYEHRDESTDFDPGEFFAGGPDPDPAVDDNGDGIPDNDRVPFGQIAIIDPVSGGFNTDEFFAELVVPLVGRDQNIPFLHSVELNGAFRYIDHSLSGGDPTWTVGATWQPIRDVTFRGNFTRSVRAPAITEFFNPRSQSFFTDNDPCDARFIEGGPNPAVRAANCAADGIPADFESDIVDFTVPGAFSGNPTLTNEKADSWTIGVVLRPSFVPRLTLAVDWVDIKVEDAVTGLTAAQVLEACYDSESFPNVVSSSGTNFCELFTRDADGQITFIETGFENASELNFEGLIAELAWRLPTPFLGGSSSIDFGLNYIYNHRLDTRAGLSDITTLRGSIGYSKHQFTANATYRNEGLAWQVQAQYFGPALNDPDAEPDAFDFPRVESVVFINSSLSYNVNDRLTVRFIVDNVFDTKNPFPTPANGGVVTYFDGVRGRYFRFGAGVRF
ncbi:TonB-dependent receptor domain-containing protein [Sphingosinicella terrae]|uniref:TonB-dependent receptor domain-containing protein n=1 Tax=Sphingosinicella terrae TaxID=2172047 RepID=UPI000E0DC180|nr:TonB-dependent receptor [Sphingosinicella terrae]